MAKHLISSFQVKEHHSPDPITANLNCSRLLPQQITEMLDKLAHTVSFSPCQVKFSEIRIDIKGISEKVVILSHHLD